MKDNPKTALQWLPPDSKADTDCTLLELWSRYYKSISRRFDNPADTVAEYSAYLKQIEEELSKKSALLMTLSDCLCAVQSSKSYMRQGQIIPYSDDAPRRRLTVLRDIFEHCENRGLLISPLRYSPFKLVGRNGKLNWNTSEKDLKQQLASKAAALKQELGNDPFLKPAEIELVKRAINNLFGPEADRDGRWLGILCYLYMGVRPWEGLHMTHGGFHPFHDHPDAYYYDVDTFGNGKGNTKPRGKTKNAIRRIPIHPELLTILRRIWAEIGNNYSDARGLPVIFLGNSFETKCTGAKMLQFVREQLRDVLGETKLTEISTIVYANEEEPDCTAQNNVEARMNDDISTRFFRHLFATKMHAETKLDDIEIRAIMGHKQDERYNDLFKEQNVYRWLLKMSFRRILPELRDDHITKVTSQTGVCQIDIGSHTLVILKDVAEKGIQIDIAMLGAEPGGNLQIELPEELPPGVKVELLSKDYFIDVLRDSKRRVDTNYDQQVWFEKAKED